MTLTFCTKEASHTYLIFQLYIPTYRPKPSKLSMNTFDLAFPIHDPAVIKVNVIPRSSFEQSWLYLSTQCYI